MKTVKEVCDAFKKVEKSVIVCTDAISCLVQIDVI